ncbi:MAG: hypothetical protein RDV48_00420 [Candidatus Eremiobacteraeota bacterium]|nr:hypothetical protein [Candidatus Eremiobacteraeota bacterium]
MFTRKTYLTGLQFAVMAALVAQGFLAIYFAIVTPNFMRAVVTHSFYKNCAWVAAMYPAFLEKTSWYTGSIIVLAVIMGYIAMRKMNFFSFIKAMFTEYVPFAEQALFMAPLTFLMLIASLFIVPDARALVPFGYYGESAFLMTILQWMTSVCFVVLLIISRYQWRHIKALKGFGPYGSVLYSILFALPPALVLYMGNTTITNFVQSGKIEGLLEFIVVNCTPRAIAIGFTLALALLGFMGGLLLPLMAFRKEEGRDYPLTREALSYLALMAVIIGGGALFYKLVLVEKLHFFTDGREVLAVTEAQATPRKALFFGEGSSVRECMLSAPTTFYTEENMERLRQYLLRHRRPTAYTSLATSRLADWHITGWDLPGAFEWTRVRIDSHYENIIDIMISLAVLSRAHSSPDLEKYVAHLADPKVFTYPGAYSCLHIYNVMLHYGHHSEAAKFMEQALKRPQGNEQVAQYLKRHNDVSEGLGVITGEVLREGKGLSGIKVRLFPKKPPGYSDDRALSEGIYQRLKEEQKTRRQDLKEFLRRTCPNFLNMRELYAVTKTDEAGRFTFSELPVDDYVVAIMLEGNESRLTAASGPGIARVTRVDEKVALPAIELK